MNYILNNAGLQIIHFVVVNENARVTTTTELTYERIKITRSEILS